MEGITDYPYRMTHAKHFPGVDAYFMPSIAVHQVKGMKRKEKNNLLPEHNKGVYAVPQLLVNDADMMAGFIRRVMDMGYQEFNLNLGCPSGTVVTKGRGAGFLKDPSALDRFFDRAFTLLEKDGVRLSVKTRIGIETPDEAAALAQVYAGYPFSELIVHPRVQKQINRGKPDLHSFSLFYEKIRVPLSYNGDICSAEDLTALRNQFPKLSRVMIGRGLIADPALVRELNGGAPASKEELSAFHDDLLDAWTEDLGDPNTALFRMKEVWDYLISRFPGAEKEHKQIRKARRRMCTGRPSRLLGEAGADASTCPQLSYGWNEREKAAGSAFGAPYFSIISYR